VSEAQYVFGYGSLLERHQGRGASGRSHVETRPAELTGYRRTWNVAMDNTRTIPGYKYYVDAETGERRDWFVVFLNVVVEPAAQVNGVLLPASDEFLSELDRRERNYERVDVSRLLSPAVSGPAWVYAGSPAAVQRFQAGLRADRAVIARGYYQQVIDDFAAQGDDALRSFEQLTEPPPCPVVDLRRIDVPSASQPAQAAP
jgi:cation transport regulator ChaC